ncbi:MAG TPA: STAS/SEC14 domain-containing protein [Thermodesulfovibrionales bacterium]|nr:STAS/SEC14 domain-containing protein [Thermodesulfovibrionales bacterium]HXX80182.1 STAS/SEC14 domain-containing protein [Thermodesulfovibrionales bacterium]
MACEIIKITDSVVHVRIRDVMNGADQKMLESVAVKLIEEGKKVRLLAVMENFKGWEKGGAGGDLGFMLEHYDDIVKMAIVGDERWKEETFLYVGKGLRSTEIEFFPTSALKKAEEWLKA